MDNSKLKLGAHISMKAPNYLVGSFNDMMAIGANALMFYTGAPQNTVRAPLEKLRIEEFKELCQAKGIDPEAIVIHAPYIVNLASKEPKSRYFARSFLKQELNRAAAMGARWVVLHPGAHGQQGIETGIKLICEGLNEILADVPPTVSICLETMAGKGTEVGGKLEEIAQIIENVNYPVYVCADTCHMNDAGYDVMNADNFFSVLEEKIGLEKVKVIHLNDSKNIRGSHMDRHENLGYGKIGFEPLAAIATHSKSNTMVKILETPWIDDYCPYKEEILMVRTRTWKDIKNLEKGEAKPMF